MIFNRKLFDIKNIKLTKFNLKISFKKSIWLSAVFFASIFSTFSQEIYWDVPKKFSENSDSRFSRTVTVASKSILFWQEIDSQNGQIFLSCSYQDETRQWKINRHFAGPFRYSGEVPDIYYPCANENKICVCVSNNSSKIEIYTSIDGGKSFALQNDIVSEKPIVSPRVFVSKNDGFILFTSIAEDVSNLQGEFDSAGYFQNRKYFMYYATSKDGSLWTKLHRFEMSKNLVNPFVPVLVHNSKFEALVFRASKMNPPSYKIYGCFRGDYGESWSEPVLLSNNDASDVQDQSPDLFVFNDEVYLAWERSERTGKTGWKKSIMSCRLLKNGIDTDSVKSIYAKGFPMSPVLFSFENNLGACWFDKSSETESVIYYSRFIDGIWERAKKLSSGSKLDIFPRPLIGTSRKRVYDFSCGKFVFDDKPSLSFLWQRNSGFQNENLQKPSLYLKESDMFTLPSKISFAPKQNIKLERHNNVSNPIINIVLPDDVSKIDGYTFSWSQNENDEPSVDESQLVSSLSQKVKADNEGWWNFKVRTHDRAGNWSEVIGLQYYYDKTPPAAVNFDELAFDENGFLISNSISVTWNPFETDSDVQHYTYHWKIRKVSGIENVFTQRKGHPFLEKKEKALEYIQNLINKNENLLGEKQYFSAANKAQTIPKTYFSNIENGLYLFTVFAVDSVGNIGEQKSIFLPFNKYQPKTKIKSITTTELSNGDQLLSIYGKDFLYDGTISSVFIDKDGKFPYDIEIKKDELTYKVFSNRIENVNLGNLLDEGSYYVGVYHTERGFCWISKPPLKIQTNGTIKIDSEYEYIPDYEYISNENKKRIDIGKLVLYSALAVSFILMIYFLIGIVFNLKDISSVKKMVMQVSLGEFMDQKNFTGIGKNGKLLKRRSLKIQLIGFTVSLVILIVVPIAFRLGSSMIKNQRLTLSQGLQDRMDFLLSSFYTGSVTYMPEKNGEYRLSSLRDQVNSVDGAQFVTITGFSKNDGKSDTLLYLWTTNDPSEEFVSSRNVVASSPMWISAYERVNDKYKELGERASTMPLIKKFSASIESIINQYGKEGVDDELNGKKEQQARIDMENALLEVAKENSGFMTYTASPVNMNESKNSFENSYEDLSFDEFNFSDFAVHVSNSIGVVNLLRNSTKDLNTKYLCYRPVLFRSGASSDYVRGIVFIQADTTSLIQEMKVVTKEIIVNVVVISIIAIIAGIIGAVFLARLIVLPIKKVMLRARAISDSLLEKGRENDVRKFEGKNIQIKRRDEIGELIASINNMTKNLVQAKYDEEEALQIAKMDQDAAVVQASLLPKERSFSNRKIEFFSYYLGADRVSGDYFDYKILDDRWVVIIKSDASGHGTPAGLITAIVATLFRKYFENWTYKTKGLKINELVSQINDFLNNLGLKGKFATIMLALYDTTNGDVYLCNAGDNIIHLFRNQIKQMQTLSLSNSPAAGQIDQFMIDMKGGYKIDKINLEKGDVLFFYTDGVEENNRILRKPDYSEYTVEELKQIQNLPETVNIENCTEEMGSERVIQILEAALCKKQYKLKKQLNPLPDENLFFDFSKGNGTSKDAIMALAGVEKIFRLYKPYTVTQENVVDVDKSVDDYLHLVFNHYDEYAHKIETSISQGSTTFVQYDSVNEEIQADDLTLIAFRRLS